MINVQKRLERIERLKDDPYYIFDKKELEKPLASTSSDVDTIPIVHLGDLMPIAPSEPLSICIRAGTLLTLLVYSTGAGRDHSPGRFATTSASKTRVRRRQGRRDAYTRQAASPKSE
jgi:hypothetical protein